VRVPEWLTSVLGDRPREVWLPALLAGWLGCALFAAALLLGSASYVWRRRQYESLVGRLERELAKLRNLPFTEPAPLEDLPEKPDPQVAKLMAELGGGDDDDPPRLAGAPGAANDERDDDDEPVRHALEAR
jgi:hypothetical protein